LAIALQIDKFDTATRAQFPDRLPDSRDFLQAEAISVVRTCEAESRCAFRRVVFYPKCAFSHLKTQTPPAPNARTCLAYGEETHFVPFSTERTGVSGITPLRRRANVSRPVSSHFPSTAAFAHSAHFWSQSPSENPYQVGCGVSSG